MPATVEQRHSHPDFARLASVFPSFKPFLIKAAEEHDTPYTIDFKNAEAVRHLNYALLYADFHINLELPDNRLCPAVNGRLDYVLWIQNISTATTTLSRELVQRSIIKNKSLKSLLSDPAFAIDVGTGASAIYALLLARIWPEISVIATDIDQESYNWAAQNIARNSFESRIKLCKTDPEDPFFAYSKQYPPSSSAFVMCNPPFYESDEEIRTLASTRELSPFATCTGSANEMITSGGESQFVLRMFEESFKYSNNIGWFSTLIGRYPTLEYIVNKLRERNVTNYAITELLQGRTKRWVIAWSHSPLRINSNVWMRETVTKGMSKFYPPPNNYKRTLKNQKFTNLCDALRTHLADIDFESYVNADNENKSIELTLTAYEPVWTRQYRRLKNRRQQDNKIEVGSLTYSSSGTNISIEEEDKVPILVIILNLCDGDHDCVVITAEWIWGYDRQHFDGFWSHLIRKLDRKSVLDTALCEK